MAQNRSELVNDPAASSLLDLGHDILTRNIPMQSGISINCLTRTCKTMYRFLQPKMNAAFLMRYVINADWNEVKKILAEHPEWMFETTKIKDINGTTLWTSPIKYALYVHDIAMQDVFSDTAKQTGRLGAYLDQAASLKRTFDFTRFKNTYQQFIKMVSKERVFELTRDADNYLGKFWREEIGSVQLYFFPRHMLKRLCAYDHDWGPESDFTNVEAQRWRSSFTIEDYRNLDQSPFRDAKIVDVLTDKKPGYILGVDYAVMHTSSQGGNLVLNGSLGCEFEYKSLCRLIDVRKLQQEERLVKLREEFASTNALTI